MALFSGSTSVKLSKDNVKTRLRCTYSVPGNTRPGGVREDFLGPGNTSPGKTQVRVKHKTG